MIDKIRVLFSRLIILCLFAPHLVQSSESISSDLRPLARRETFLSPLGQVRLELETSPRMRARIFGARGALAEWTDLDLVTTTSYATNRFLPTHVSSARIGSALNITVQSVTGMKLKFHLTDKLVAYRFEVDSVVPYRINEETTQVNIAGFRRALGQTRECQSREPACFNGPNEEHFVAVPMRATQIAWLPMLVQTTGPSLFLGEMNTRSYAGAYLKPTGPQSFRYVSPGTPLRYGVAEWGGFTIETVLEYQNHIGEFSAGRFVLPWRFIRPLQSEADLMDRSPILALADQPSPAQDMSWIERGFGTDEWIVNSLIDLPPEELGFTPGLNTETYRYYIDFAQAYGLKYVIFDAGWTNNDNIYQRNPDIDLPWLSAYAHSKGIKPILWVQLSGIRTDLEAKLDYLKSLGAAAIKVDFIERDDIAMSRVLERLYVETFKRKLMVIMHGLPRPAGQDITHPHVMSFEAGLTHEYSKGSAAMTPEHKLNLVFFRNPIGSFDSEAGAFRNVWPEDFSVDWVNPLAMGTRTSEISPYVLLESKLPIIAGNLGDYVRNPLHTKFLTRIPTRWDQVVPLSARLGDHALVAKRSGDIWYIAALSALSTNRFDSTALQVNLNRFLQPGVYEIEQMADCEHPSAPATCARLQTFAIEVTAVTSLPIPMARFGGYVARITRR